MDIDRSRFLLLTASLAAAACNRPPGATIPDTGGAEPAASNDDATEDKDQDASPKVWLEIEPGSEDDPNSRASATCDNTVTRGPVTCDLSAPSGHCESFASTQQMCRKLPQFMVPRAAEAAVDCFHAASGTQRICSWEIWNQCVEAGLQTACVEPETRARCQSISSACGGSVDVFHCQQAISGVVPRFADQVASCVQEICEVPFCITDLQYYL